MHSGSGQRHLFVERVKPLDSNTENVRHCQKRSGQTQGIDHFKFYSCPSEINTLALREKQQESFKNRTGFTSSKFLLQLHRSSGKFKAVNVIGGQQAEQGVSLQYMYIITIYNYIYNMYCMYYSQISS